MSIDTIVTVVQTPTEQVEVARTELITDRITEIELATIATVERVTQGDGSITTETVYRVDTVTQGQQGPPGPVGPAGAGALDTLLLFTSKANEDTAGLDRCMVVYSSSPTGIKRALARGAGASRVVGLTALPLAQGGSGLIQTAGLIRATIDEWDLVTGTVGGLVTGAIYYLDAASRGHIVLVPSLAGGDYVCAVGRAHSPTEFFIDIVPRIQI